MNSELKCIDHFCRCSSSWIRLFETRLLRARDSSADVSPWTPRVRLPTRRLSMATVYQCLYAALPAAFDSLFTEKTGPEHRDRYFHNRLVLKTRYETRAILNYRLPNCVLVSSHLSCGPQCSKKNYIHNIPLEQDWYSDVTRPFLSRAGTPD